MNVCRKGLGAKSTTCTIASNIALKIAPNHGRLLLFLSVFMKVNCEKLLTGQGIWRTFV